MPTKRKTSTKRAKRQPWSRAEIKQLRALAGRHSLQRIARELGRTRAAARRKATQQGISLAMKRM